MQQTVNDHKKRSVLIVSEYEPIVVSEDKVDDEIRKIEKQREKDSPA